MNAEHGERKSAWAAYESDEQRSEVFAFAERYKRFLDAAKTEREAVAVIVQAARENGFLDLAGAYSLKPGDRFYTVNRDKAVIIGRVGQLPPEAGFSIVGAHLDAPRLDLKPRPLYEDQGQALFKTHYYGGIKKYQWLTVPLALHGTVCRSNGECISLVIGEAPGEPVFTISDLLPHLAKDQVEKKMSEAVPGEGLNLIVGSIPLAGAEKEPVRQAVLEYLARVYGIAEDDLVSAEIEAVPAWKAADIGFDRGLVGGYGQDDRICAFAAVQALFEANQPAHTGLTVLVDKEEIGSTGNTGMLGAFFENTAAELLARLGPYSDLILRRTLAASCALSADVNAALDPNFTDVLDKYNAARLGGGVVITKYTGSKGKYSANDAHAEFVGAVLRTFKAAGVRWQSGELGKVDQGGGGTIAHILAAYGMDVLDCGPALLSMHAPFEIASKVDLFEAFRGYRAFFERNWG